MQRNCSGEKKKMEEAEASRHEDGHPTKFRSFFFFQPFTLLETFVHFFPQQRLHYSAPLCTVTHDG